MEQNVHLTDHDLLIELRTEMKGLRETLTSLSLTILDKSNDHEIRIRRLEMWGFLAIGALTVMEFAFKFFIK